MFCSFKIVFPMILLNIFQYTLFTCSSQRHNTEGMSMESVNTVMEKEQQSDSHGMFTCSAVILW